MRIHDALNDLKNRLPVQRNGKSYKDTLLEEFAFFNKMFDEIEDADLETLFNSISSYESGLLTKRKMVSFINDVQFTILDIIQKYYNGYPEKAYTILADLLGNTTFPPLRDELRKRYRKTCLNEIYGNYFRVKIESEPKPLFRMRIDKEILSREGLFHVPFDNRERVSTARFSILGYPCLYLGTSLMVCWEEIKRKRKKNEKVFACKYQNRRFLILLNLTIPDTFTEDGITSDPQEIFRFLITYPFYSACLIKVQYPEQDFKPEYIIPQILLQYVKNENNRGKHHGEEFYFDGIIYSSTKSDNYNEASHNIVIPTRKIADAGHCEELKERFFLSEIKEIKPNIALDDSIFDSCTFSKILST